MQESKPRLLIADTETTGLSGKDEVCELAFIEVDENLNPGATYETLIKTNVPMTSGASKRNGITDEMLASAPTMPEVLEEAPGSFDNVLLIAHNSPFDTRMLTPDWNIVKQFDTLRAARKLYPGMPNHELGTLKEELGLPNRGEAHTALADTGDVYELVKRMMVDTGLNLLELIDDARMPVEVKFAPWGKHINKPLTELPAKYVEWLLSLDDLDTDYRIALEKL